MAYDPVTDLALAKMVVQAGPAWCFSDNAGTVPCNVGDVVARWTNRTGGAAYTQTTNGLRGILRQNVNGRYGVEFAWASNTEYTTLLAALASGAQCLAFSASQIAGETGFPVRTINSGSLNGLLVLNRSLVMYANGIVSQNYVTDGAEHVLLAAKAGSGGTWRVRRDSADITDSPDPLNSQDFGVPLLGGSESFTGILYGFVAAESNPTGAAQTNLEAWLASLYMAEPAESSSSSASSASSAASASSASSAASTSSASSEPSSSSASACDPYIIAVQGRQGIGVVQPQSGIDFPLVGPPSPDIRYLLADMYLSYDDPADYNPQLVPFKPPFRIRWLSGLGCLPSESLPDWVPTATHDVDILIVDDNDETVFDSTQSVGFQSQPWGDRLHIYGWETDTGVLRLVAHTAWPDGPQPTPQQYEIDIVPVSAVLDERTIERRPKRVKSLTVILDNFTRTGVDWLEGFNMEMLHLGETIRGNRIIQRISFDATAGNGLGLFPVCDEPPLVITRINGVPPEDNGNFFFAATDCYGVRQPTDVVSFHPRRTEPTPAMLQVTSDCGPCCPCDDYVATDTYMKRIRNQYKQIGRDAEMVRDQYHENRDRWNEAKCCFEQHPLRLVMQPQVCPYIDVAGQFCNMTDQCVENFQMQFDFRELVIDQEVSLSSGSSVGISASLGLGLPSYSVEEVPGFTFIRGAERAPGRRSGKLTRYDLGGHFPELRAWWDSVEPYQTVWVRFRLRIIPLENSLDSAPSSASDPACPTDAVTVKVNLTATSGGNFITVPNCGPIPSEPFCAEPGRFPSIARAEGVVILNCPTDDTFFWDPYRCPSKDC